MTYRELRHLLMQMTDEQLNCKVVYFARKQTGEEIHAVNTLAPLVGLQRDSSSANTAQSPYQYALTSPLLRGKQVAPRQWSLRELIDAFGEPTGGGVAPVTTVRANESIELHDTNLDVDSPVVQLNSVPLSGPIPDLDETTWLAWLSTVPSDARLRIAMRPTKRDAWTLIVDERIGPGVH